MQEFWIDVGGTFTDCIGRDAEGHLRTHKLLSSGVYHGRVKADATVAHIPIDLPEGTPSDFFRGFVLRCANAESSIIKSYDAKSSVLHLLKPLSTPAAAGSMIELISSEPAPVTGMRFLSGIPYPNPLGKVSLKLGTTRGTNALLERKGARIAVVLTKGFGDLLAIGYQNRPRLFDIAIRKASPLYERSIEASERLRADGSVEYPLDRIALRKALAKCRQTGIETLAVCLLHAHVNDAHERIVEEEAHKLGFREIVLSSRIAPLERVVARAETTVLDAYLTPLTRTWLDSIRAAIPDGDFKVMTSSGGLVQAKLARGKDLVLSGPAGGAVGVAEIARQAELGPVLGFDMGGTSTDVCRYDGNLDRRYEMELLDPASGAGMRVMAPMLTIDTVAAGGGSICRFDGIRLTVGPGSAGAAPGPAAYGHGGPLTITDCNVVLGRIRPERFAFPLDLDAARSRLTEVARTIANVNGHAPSLEDLAEGFLAVAVSTMAGAVKRLALARGQLAHAHTLLSFGGAGAQHACQIAEELGIKRVLQPIHASLMSAYGIGVADVAKYHSRDFSMLFDDAAVTQIEREFLQLEIALDSELDAEGLPMSSQRMTRRLLDLRYVGQDHAMTIEILPGQDLASNFAAMHQQTYGFSYPGRAIEVRTLRIERIARLPKAAASSIEATPYRAATDTSTPIFIAGHWRDAPCFDSINLSPGATIVGPALVTGGDTSLLVAPGWQAVRTKHQHWLLERLHTMPEERNTENLANAETAADPVQLALFANRFTQIAEQMGTMLQRTALSVNVKERLDFSCALFDATGALVVNAPHIPVHLGSMGDTVRALLAEKSSEIAPGDVFVSNDPYRGGSHLPDVTVITPVFDDETGQLMFFTGSRAHHAEIGGITPGSMPPFSRRLSEEGILIRWYKLVDQGVPKEQELRVLLSQGEYPSRSPDDNIADLRAQVAAGETGRRLLLAMMQANGKETVLGYMRHMRLSAELKTRQVLASLPRGKRRFADALDDGTAIVVQVELTTQSQDSPAAIIDFTGTGPVNQGNLNANTAIVKAATLYTLRCLIAEDIPLNEGVLNAVRIIIPSPSILSPRSGQDPSTLAAVVGGNVETSQRLVDVLFAAFGLAAASQGTMNNFLFGRTATADRAGFGYYETICGGSGASPNDSGADAVHSHMTNTRITDPEVLERRYPVILRMFAIRRESGGAGQHRGGDGIIREIEMLEPLQVSLLTTRRKIAPFGLAGGQPGQTGRNVLLRKNGEQCALDGMVQIQTEAGDRIRIETPGGGGYGTAS